MQALTRRGFVSTAAAAATALGANERVRVASIGCGGRGQHLMRMAKAAGGAEFVAVCDAWDVRRREAAAYLEKELPGPKVEQYADYRRVLERQDVDAVIVAIHGPLALAHDRGRIARRQRTSSAKSR